MAAAAGLLAPIVQAMLRRVLLSEVFQTDDTLVQVEDHDGKESRPAGSASRSMIWPID